MYTIFNILCHYGLSRDIAYISLCPLLHCGWECKLVQPLWRIVWRFLPFWWPFPHVSVPSVPASMPRNLPSSSYNFMTLQVPKGISEPFCFQTAWILSLLAVPLGHLLTSAPWSWTHKDLLVLATASGIEDLCACVRAKLLQLCLTLWPQRL